MKRQIIIFFVLSCFISWSLKFIVSAETLGWLNCLVPRGLLDLGAACGPSLAGIISIFLFEGSKGISVLLNRLTSFSHHPVWYLFAVFFEPVMFIMVVGFAAITGYMGTRIIAGAIPPSIGSFFASLVTLAILTGLGEEIGWRGFLLPRILAFKKIIIALIFLSLLNSLWHLKTNDLALLLSGDSNGFFLVYLPDMLERILISIPVNFILAWLFNKTRGSLVIMIIWHGSANASWEWVREITGNSDPSYLLHVWIIMLWLTMIISIPALLRQKRNNELVISA
jgi:membrane protease YdiL (CAAX protease family)